MNQTRRRSRSHLTRVGPFTAVAGLLAWAITFTAVSPARAANKEHQQLMADIRMLQEQSQILQNLIGSLNETLKAVNARLDEQANVSRKTFADQKLLIDNLSSDLRVVREKVDDNNVRIASLTQELDSLRQVVQQSTARSPSADSTPATGTAPPSAESPAAAVSPKQLYETAFSDYTAGRYELAIQGFEGYLLTFPKSEQASSVQVLIGKSNDLAGNKQKALDAYDKAIRDYPNGKGLPDAWFYKGAVLLDLKQPDKAREAFEFCAKTYQKEPAGMLCQERLEQLRKDQSKTKR